jgi:hypothetical protein
MADVAVDSYANTVPPHKKQLSSSIPNIESLEGIGADSDDQYSTFKKLQRQLECVASSCCHGICANSRQIHQAARRVHQG